ncbi:MAG TPA: hypothetical protein VII96_00835 [Acidimicrobiales bacterium]
MTLVELLVTSTVLIVLLGMVFISLTMVEGLSGSVTSQFQEFQQTLPAMAPFHTLLAAEVEPAPPSAGVPTPGFASLGNFALTFYANVGTAFNNTTSCPSGQSCSTGGTTAGPAMIVAVELGGDGNPVTALTACSAAQPCSFQMRMYLPLTGLTAPGVSSCPGVGTGPTCQYSADFRLLANVQNVVNDPSSVDANGAQNDPIFGYTVLDTGGIDPVTGTTYSAQAITLTAAQVQTQQLTGVVLVGYPVINPQQPTSYPISSQLLTACAAPSANYPTVATACPADAVQSVSVDLKVAKPGTGSNGTQENNLVVYRFAQSPGSSTAPYQYSAAVG